VIATKPVDFRKGHDGLAAMAHGELGFAPKAGVMVVFRSKRGDRIKVQGATFPICSIASADKAVLTSCSRIGAHQSILLRETAL
ncbi:MAG: IS66 family insertion sequence element accessory protein TnpB, partial [Pseudotabrizicola sp.]